MYEQAAKDYNPNAMSGAQISKDGPITEQVHRLNKSLEGMGTALAALEDRLSPVLLSRSAEKNGPTAVPAANCQLHGQLIEMSEKAAIQRQSLHELIGRIQL